MSVFSKAASRKSSAFQWRIANTIIGPNFTNWEKCPQIADDSPLCNNYHSNSFIFQQNVTLPKTLPKILSNNSLKTSSNIEHTFNLQDRSMHMNAFKAHLVKEFLQHKSAKDGKSNLQAQGSLIENSKDLASSRKKTLTLSKILNHFHHHNSEFFKYKSEIKYILKQNANISTLLQFLLQVENNPSIWINIMPLNQLQEAEWIKYSELIHSRLVRAFRIKSHWEWTRISQRDLINESCNQLTNLDFFLQMLRLWYPNTHFTETAFHRNKRSRQRILMQAIRELFEEYSSNHSQRIMGYDSLQVIEEKTLSLRNENGDLENIQVDILLPQLNLVIEYQGEQHYTQNTRSHLQRMVRTIHNDERRLSLFDHNGLFHVEIPYWWDQNLNSLQATIHAKYPFLVPPCDAFPIPDAIQPRGSKIEFDSKFRPSILTSNTCKNIIQYLENTSPIEEVQTDCHNSCISLDTSKHKKQLIPHEFYVQRIPNGIFVTLYNGKLYTSNGDEIATPFTFFNHTPKNHREIHGILYSEVLNLQSLRIIIHNQDTSIDIWSTMKFQVLFEKDQIQTDEPKNLSLDTVSESNCDIETQRQIANQFFIPSNLDVLRTSHWAFNFRDALKEGICGHLIYSSRNDKSPFILLPQHYIEAQLIDIQDSKIFVENTWGNVLILQNFKYNGDLVPFESILQCEFSRVYQAYPDEITAAKLIQNPCHTSANSTPVIPIADFVSEIKEALKIKGWNLEEHSYSQKSKTDLIYDVLQSKSDIYPTPEEQLHLSELLHESLSQIQKMLQSIRRRLRHFQGEISMELKQKIEAMLLESNTLTQQDIQALSEEYNVGEKRLSVYIRSRETRKSRIPLTQSQMDSLRSWADTHNPSELSPSILQELSESTNLSTSTIKNYLYDRIKRRGPFSTVQRKILHAWFETHQYENLSDSEIQTLSTQTQLPATRIRSFLYALHHRGKNELTDDARKFLREYVDRQSREHASVNVETTITKELLDQLANQLNVSVARVKSYIHQYLHITSISLTDKEKAIILSHWEDFQCTSPSDMKTLDKLSSMLQVPSARISHYLHAKERTGKLKAEQSETLSDWASNNEYQALSTKQLKQLSQETGVSEKRARAFIYSLKSRHLNDEQQTILQDWISRHNQKDLTADELEKLYQKLGGNIIKSRIKRYIRDRMPIYSR